MIALPHVLAVRVMYSPLLGGLVEVSHGVVGLVMSVDSGLQMLSTAQLNWNRANFVLESLLVLLSYVGNSLF